MASKKGETGSGNAKRGSNKMASKPLKNVKQAPTPLGKKGGSKKGGY
jgi:hypothetical protein